MHDSVQLGDILRDMPVSVPVYRFLPDQLTMNRLAVSRSARAQQAHKVNNRINQLIPVGTGPFKQHIITYVLKQLLKPAVA